MFDIRITKNRTCLLVQPSTPSTIKFLSIAYLSLLDYLAFLYTGLRLSWLGAPVAWYWEQAGPHGPSLHLLFLKILSWLPYYIYSTLLTLVLNSTTYSRLFFSAWPGSGAPLTLEGALYKFLLID